MRLFLLTILLALSVAARPQVAGTFEQPDALVKAGVKRVKCMLRDSRGFLWIGTETGLFRYDGTNVDLLQHEADGPVALPNNMIAGLAEDRAGNIWVGTMHGAARVDPNTLQCTVYSTPRHNIDFDFDLKPLVSRDGRVWLGGNEGLTVLEGGRFRTVWRGKSNPPDNAWYVNAITEWKRDTLALGTFRGLVLYNTRDGGYRRLFREEDITVTRLLVDTHGRLWMGTWANGCWILDSSGRVYTMVAPDKPVRGKIRNIVTGILETGGPAAPRYWVSTEDAIYQMGEPPAKGMNPRDIAKVATTGAACLTEDNDHHVWIGGVTVKRVFAGHSQFAALPTEIKGLVTGIQGVTYHHQPAIAFTTWYVPGGLTVTNPDASTIYYKRTVKGDGANVSGLALDSKGRYWLSTLTGLDILDGEFRPLPHADTLFRGRDQLVTPRTNGVLIHRDTAWVAYYRRGLSIYDMHFHLLRSFARDDGSGMADDLINCMFEHGGTVWLGGDNGLYRYDAAAGRFRLYNLNPDQSSFNVSDIDALPGGDLILATGSGLFRFSPATGSGTKIRSPLFGNNVIEAVTVDAGGDIWFVNREHLVYYRVNSGHFMLFGTEDGLEVHDDLNTLRSPDGVHFFAGGNDVIYTFDRSSRN